MKPVEILGERVDREDEVDANDHQARHQVVDHIPAQSREPEVEGVDAAHKLDVLGLDGALPDQEEHEAACQEGHAEGHVKTEREAGWVLAKALVVDLGEVGNYIFTISFSLSLCLPLSLPLPLTHLILNHMTSTSYLIMDGLRQGVVDGLNAVLCAIHKQPQETIVQSGQGDGNAKMIKRVERNTKNMKGNGDNGQEERSSDSAIFIVKSALIASVKTHVKKFCL